VATWVPHPGAARSHLDGLDVVVEAIMLQDTLEKELKEWRESRSRMNAAAAELRVKTFSSHGENRRVKVNGQEVVVVSRAKRPG
jgi:DNA-binding LytR/AlgR family response regulator